MSMVSSSQVTVTIKSVALAQEFQKYETDIRKLFHDVFFVPSDLAIQDDFVTICVADVDRPFSVPRALDEVMEELIILCSGCDEELIACLEEGEDVSDLEEDLGTITAFCSVLFDRSEEFTQSIECIRWEMVREEEESGEVSQETFSYDEEHGEQYFLTND